MRWVRENKLLNGIATTENYFLKYFLKSGEPESGITIHFVNEKFDEGEILHQSRFKIEPGDNLEMIKFKGQQLEHQYFPRVIESLLKKMKS